LGGGPIFVKGKHVSQRKSSSQYTELGGRRWKRKKNHDSEDKDNGENWKKSLNGPQILEGKKGDQKELGDSLA